MEKQKDPKQTILAVDDTPENLDILKGILTPGYAVKAAINGKIALKIATQQAPDLILLDIMMPEMDGYEVCKQLKANPTTAKIPIIFVTAMNDTLDEKRGFSVGAVDYITKPVQPEIVQARVKTHLALAYQQKACEKQVKRRTQQLETSQHAAISMLGEAGHYNDTDTGAHIFRMASYAAAIARVIHWPVAETATLELAATMHDTGKIGISDILLKAPRKLTTAEMVIMKTHTTIGHTILKKSSTPLFQMAAVIALSHHERWDGSGYPHELKGNDIPEAARITAIADVFDALTMKRAYKEVWPLDKAFETIQKKAGSHFEPRLVEAFFSVQSEILELREWWNTKQEPHP